VWDGVPRIETFCSTYLGAEDTPYHRALSRYWWTAHAGRVLCPAGVQADAAIILVSQQGTGKTQLTKAIAPRPDFHGAINLSGDHYNRIREMRGRVVIELAELQGLKSRDAESIKAIISAMGDTFVDKWEKHAQDVVRRCVFIGSSNNDDFLSDPTGNRRFLPLYVGDHQDIEGVLRDRDQLWAEGAVLFELLEEVDWREVQRLVLAEHCKFEEVDVWEDRVWEWLDDPKNWQVMLSIRGERASGPPYVTCTMALLEALHMDLQKQSARDMHRVVRIFVRYGLKKMNHRVSGRQTKIWVRKENNVL
jgi:predicted P-loop ATPase